jgi:hypothetical protein
MLDIDFIDNWVIEESQDAFIIMCHHDQYLKLKIMACICYAHGISNIPFIRKICNRAFILCDKIEIALIFFSYFILRAIIPYIFGVYSLLALDVYHTLTKIVKSYFLSISSHFFKCSLTMLLSRLFTFSTVQILDPNCSHRQYSIYQCTIVIIANLFHSF